MTGSTAPTPPGAGFPQSLSLLPVSRRPLRLRTETIEHVAARPVPSGEPLATGHPEASVVVVTLDNLPLTRMTLESVLANTTELPYEIIVVDNGSRDGTADYVSDISSRNPRVRIIRNAANRGFAAATNQGLRMARGDLLVLLNNDTLVPPRSLSRILAHLEDPTVGLVCPVTNRCGNEAEVRADYDTYGGLLAFAARRQEAVAMPFDIPVAEMFCVAMRRGVLDAVGPLDERFEVGLFEDDDYSRRVRRAGFRVVCAEDVFVHHFGEGSFGRLVSSGRYAAVFAANRRRFEEKWGVRWQGHGRRTDPEYQALRTRLGDAVRRHVPPGSVVLVVSKGDDALVDLSGREGWHFPRALDGGYAGYYPADDCDAIDQLERSRCGGARYLVVPSTSMWWLEHYCGFRDHLDEHHHELATIPDVGAIYALIDTTATHGAVASGLAP